MRRSSQTACVTLAVLLLVCVAAKDAVTSSATLRGDDSLLVESDEFGRQRVEGGIGFLGRLHPLAVHFPIALIVMAGLSEALFMWRRNEAFASAARVMLPAAAAFAVISAILGFAAASGRSVPHELGVAFGVHRVLGVVTAGLAVLAAGLAEGARQLEGEWRVKLYRVVLLLAMIAAAIGAHSGATLVFGRGYFSIL